MSDSADAIAADVPASGSLFAYLARARNGCALPGQVGTWSDGTSRIAGSCP